MGEGLYRVIVAMIATACICVGTAQREAAGQHITQPPPPTMDARAAQLQGSIVFVTVTTHDGNDQPVTEYGTGVIVSDRHLLTAAHLFFDREGNLYELGDVVVSGRLGEIGEPSIELTVLQGDLPSESDFRTDPTSDVTMLRLPLIAGGYEAATMCIVETPGARAPLFAFGFPSGRNYRGREGQFEIAGPDDLWDTTIDFEEGFSGGPVTDADGRVVGLVVSGTRETKMVLPLRFVRDLLARRSGRSPQDCSRAQTVVTAQADERFFDIEATSTEPLRIVWRAGDPPPPTLYFDAAILPQNGGAIVPGSARFEWYRAPGYEVGLEDYWRGCRGDVTMEESSRYVRFHAWLSVNFQQQCHARWRITAREVVRHR